MKILRTISPKIQPLSIKNDQQPIKDKNIRRPPNAFMIFANENRKKMADLHPVESNKDISRRLGNTWKSLDPLEKAKYFDIAKKVLAEHKNKYPDYVYNPKEARMRKAMREASKERSVVSSRLRNQNRGTRHPQVWQTPSPDDQLMMNPPSDVHPAPTFAYPHITGSYEQQTRPYAKIPTNNNWANSSFYDQGHGLHSMQHQQPMTMWHNAYSENRNVASNYHHQSHTYSNESTDMISRENCSGEKNPFEGLYQMQASGRVDGNNVVINVTENNKASSSSAENDENLNKETSLSLPICCPSDNGGENSQQYAQIFSNSPQPAAASDIPRQNDYVGKEDAAATASDELPSLHSPMSNNANVSTHSTTSSSSNKVKALPDFNEAFGSTERGRFQSPPDPRLISSKCFDDFNLHFDEWVRFDEFRI